MKRYIEINRKYLLIPVCAEKEVKTVSVLCRNEKIFEFAVPMHDRESGFYCFHYFAPVNVEKYQIVATGTSIQKTLSEYKKLLRDSGEDTSSATSQEISGTIEDIRMATMDGNSIYFIKLKDKKSFYMLDISEDRRVSILNVGEDISLEVDIIPDKLK